MNPQLVAAFLQLGAVGAMLVWLTLVLIPNMQKQQDKAIEAFKNDAEKERISHQTMTERWVNVHEKAVDGMLEHMRTDHMSIKP